MIRELPTSEQPVHRLEHFGAGALSTVELLAIILGSDNFEDPAALLADNERLFGLAQLPWEQLVAVKGIGPTRAARVKAAFEIGRRLQVAMPEEKAKIKSPADAANLLMLDMMALEQEHLKVVILDTKNHVLKSPHRLHRLAEHRRRPRRRALPRGHPPQRRRHHRTVTTIPAAILARPPKMSMSPGKSWRPAS